MERTEEMKLYSQLKNLLKLHYSSTSKVRLSDSDLKRCLNYIEKIDNVTNIGYDNRVYNGDGKDFFLRKKKVVTGLGSMSADSTRRKGYKLKSWWENNQYKNISKCSWKVPLGVKIGNRSQGKYFLVLPSLLITLRSIHNLKNIFLISFNNSQGDILWKSQKVTKWF